MRGEPGQLVDAQGRLFEAPGKQQRGREQPHQLRRPQHQFIALLFMQAQQQHGVLLAKQILETEVLQQAHRHFIFLRQQRLLERGLPVTLGAEPLARASVPGAFGRPGFVAQQSRQRWENVEPVAGVFPGLDKRTQCLQFAQMLSAVTTTEQVLTQVQVETRQMGQHAPSLSQWRRQGVEQLMLQVIEQGLVGVAVAQQGDTHTGAPTGAELHHAVDAMPRGEQLLDFLSAEKQLAALQQLIVEQQAWPIAQRAPSRAQPPGQLRAASGEQTVQQRIQLRRR